MRSRIEHTFLRAAHHTGRQLRRWGADLSWWAGEHLNARAQQRPRRK